MMKDHGGPAFPKADTIQTKENHYGDYPKIIEGSEGMSLRDWFAGMALQRMIANDSWHPGNEGFTEWQASEAYKLADAMLKERAKP